MKKKVLNIISILLIASGLIIIGFIIVAQTSSANKNKQLINQFQNAAVSETSTDPNQALQTKDVSDQAIAILTIPKIDLKVAVVEGTTMAGSSNWSWPFYRNSNARSNW